MHGGCSRGNFNQDHQYFHTSAELLLLSTPASKFEGGLRCALGGAFGVDASLAAAAQRDAGATIVNVTSSVQHIPHVSTLATGNLSQTLTLLQESLMDVYTAYRGVVQKHSGLANLVQSSVLLHFLEYTCRQQPPTAREGNLETANPIGAYLKSQVSPANSKTLVSHNRCFVLRGRSSNGAAGGRHAPALREYRHTSMLCRRDTHSEKTLRCSFLLSYMRHVRTI